MLGHLYEGQDCSAARTLELVGERWSLLILREAMFRGSTRFSDFQRELAIAPNILTKRLAGFVESGLMTLSPDGRYQLTQRGMELKAVIVALTHWGDKWLGPGPVIYIDGKSGRPVEQVMTAGRGRVRVEAVAAKLRKR
jgi:DNA-binding HxlR family transcriptional regulator